MNNLLAGLLKDPSFSRYRESLLEHIFISDIVQAAWLKGKLIVVSKAEIDAWGYDIVLSCNGITRHIQMKSQTRSKSVNVNGKLAQTPGSCVVKAIPSVENGKQRLKLHYHLFGFGPFTPLDFSGFKNAKLTRHVKGENGQALRKERKGHYKIPVSSFGPPLNAEQLIEELFPNT